MDSILSSSPFSSEIRKKIKRNFFKSDVALKSYKCDFIGPDTNTRAKLYISARAIHVVHRPKRRKLTTIPFAGVQNIVSHPDAKSIDIHIHNELVYTFTRFERPDSAVGFILNFWNMVRKDKLLSKQAAANLRPRECNSSSVERISTTSADAGLPFSDSLDNLKAPTTISFNSSASISESESVNSQKLLSSAKASVCSQSSVPPMRDYQSWPVRTTTSDTRNQKAASGSPVSVRSVKPVGSSPANTPSSPLTDPSDLSSQSIPNTSTHKRPSTPSSPPVDECSRSNRLSIAASNDTLKQTPVKCRPLSRPNPVVIPKTVPCLTEPSNWMVWPLSLLPLPFSSSPQRFTMVIAYVILTFLLLSTIHLYHRLAIFDLHGNRILDHRSRKSTLSSTAELHNTLVSLHADLSQLVTLAEQLTRSLLKLTTELADSSGPLTFQSDPSTKNQDPQSTV